MMTAQADFSRWSVEMEFAIRSLHQEDLPKLEWYGQFKHYRRLFRRSYMGQIDGSRLMLVADINDFPIGRLFIQFNSPRSKVSNGRTRAYLYSFHVMEMFRGIGIGSRLIKSAEAVLRKRDFHYATIAVAKENTGALRLYKRHNYHVYGEDAGNWQYSDHHGRIRHVDEPCWLLEKRL